MTEERSERQPRRRTARRALTLLGATVVLGGFAFLL
jgi:hypothetical protein